MPGQWPISSFGGASTTSPHLFRAPARRGNRFRSGCSAGRVSVDGARDGHTAAELVRCRAQKDLGDQHLCDGCDDPDCAPDRERLVRSDSALALLHALRPYFKQFVIVSDVYFLKKLLEEGRALGMQWRRWPVQICDWR